MIKSSQFNLVSQLLSRLSENAVHQPDLGELARATGLSPSHLQRVFQEWAGVSPKQFLKYLTRESARQRLLEGQSVLDTSLDVGLTGPGRLHDLMVTTDSLTPGEVKLRGRGVTLHFGCGTTPFGPAILSWNERGITFLGFCNEVTPVDVIDQLQSQWSNANFARNDNGAQIRLKQVFEKPPGQPIRVWLRGSPFQLKVWEALIAIPDGSLVSYGTVAHWIGKPSAARAVGSAIGSNPIAWLIPCHRVIRQVGELGEYRWGRLCKSAMIGMEAANIEMSGNSDNLSRV
jgi:AraC family transcriptional regulator of adaptative response/methylated-DNA-[protein]-cysteine methyltransferase